MIKKIKMAKEKQEKELETAVITEASVVVAVEQKGKAWLLKLRKP